MGLSAEIVEVINLEPGSSVGRLDWSLFFKASLPSGLFVYLFLNIEVLLWSL